MISRLRSSSEGVGTVVLDFDGVLCDGQEKTRSAWRTGLRKWPDVMGMAKDITPQEAGVRSSWVGYEWSSYEEDNGDDIPRWLEEKLKQVCVLNDVQHPTFARWPTVAARQSQRFTRTPPTPALPCHSRG